MEFVTQGPRDSDGDARLVDELAGPVASGHAREAEERAAKARTGRVTDELARLLACKISECGRERQARMQAEEEIEALHSRLAELQRSRRRFRRRAELEA